SRVSPCGHVDDKNSRPHANLRRRKADAWSCVHGVDHVVNNALNLIRDYIDRSRGLVEEIVAVFEDWSDHAKSVATTTINAEAAENAETLIRKSIDDTLQAPSDKPFDVEIDQQP